MHIDQNQVVDAKVNLLTQAPTPTTTSRLAFASSTHVGRTRKLNEDSLGVLPELGLAIVADGMGGHDAGEVASKLAVDQISAQIARRLVVHSAMPGESDTVKAGTVIKDAISTACEKIYELNQAMGRTDGKGMGTTAVVVKLDPQTNAFTFANVGDSRIYHLQSGGLTQLTEDHTALQYWLDHGRKGPPPKKNVIVRALGPWKTTEVDIGDGVLAEGDKLLLCSDGLHGLLSDLLIQEILNSSDNLDECCEKLISLANELGGKDNISVIVIGYN